VWTTALWEHNHQPVQWVVVMLASAAAAVTDARSRRIPNALTAPLLLAGLLWSYSVAGGAGLADSASACLLLAAPYVALFIFAGGGAGDAKLMGAIGSWLGLVNGLIVLTCVSVAAIAMAIALTVARKQARSAGAKLVTLFWEGLFFLLTAGKTRFGADALPDGGSHKMPYGVAICAGVVVAAGGAMLWRTWRT
jgi:prepilin peptidase CpaA